MTAIDVSLTALDARLQSVAEGGGGDHPADAALAALAFVDASGALTDAGHDYYLARHVRDDGTASAEALFELLSRNAVASAFCGFLWGVGDVPVAGAASLLKRLGVVDDASAKRWLELMNRARLVMYNRKQPKLRVLFNPDSLVSPDEDAMRERDKGHVITHETPFGNLLALRDLLRAAREHLYWYEQHMTRKTLEVLYRELAKGSVTVVRLLSGPANVGADTKSDFKRFAKEMKTQRAIDCEWRVLSKNAAQSHHDRFLFTEGMRRNLPPLNLILQGSTGEILPSDVTEEEFEDWWTTGTDLLVWSIMS